MRAPESHAVNLCIVNIKCVELNESEKKKQKKLNTYVWHKDLQFVLVDVPKIIKIPDDLIISDRNVGFWMETNI